MLVPFVVALIAIAALAIASLVQVRRAGRGRFDIAVIGVASIIAVAVAIVAFIPGTSFGGIAFYGWPIPALFVSALLMSGAPSDTVAAGDEREGAAHAGRMSKLARRALSHWSSPTVLAVLLALLSLPLVAISLDAVQAPPWVGAMNCKGGIFDSREPCVYDGLPLTDLGRWAAAAGAVLAAALISGTIGGWIVRRHAVTGGIFTVLLAWEVAVAALPVLPSLFHLDVDFGYAADWASWGAQIQSSNPTSGLGVASAIPFLQLEWCRESVPFALLLVGVVAWTALLRRFPVSGSETTSQIRVDIPSPVDDAGVGASR
jgi:hypothetical protein